MLSIGQLILWAETIAVAFLAIAAIYLNMVPDWAAEQIAQKKVYPSLPGILAGRERFQMLDRALQRNRAEAAIPNIRQAVGAASVGHHGFFPGFILLNGLNFRSSPTLMTYVAVNEPLMRMNAEFYRNDATAPSFVLSLVGALDGFFPPQEDSLALLQLLRRYRPVLVEKGQLLLKRVPVAGPEPSFKPVQSPQEYTWGDRIALPDHKGRMLWCQVAIDASLTGRIRSFLYKPPRITMMLERDGRSLATFGFLQSAGKVGFLIDPVILDNGDLLVAYPNISATDLPRKPPPDALRFQVAIGDRRYFQHRITVSFSTLEKPQ